MLFILGKSRGFSYINHLDGQGFRGVSGVYVVCVVYYFVGTADDMNSRAVIVLAEGCAEPTSTVQAVRRFD